MPLLVSLVTRMQIEDAERNALDVGSGSSALDELTNGWPNKEACSHRIISLSLSIYLSFCTSLGSDHHKSRSQQAISRLEDRARMNYERARERDPAREAPRLI